jgi:hypothetical protein
MGDQATFIGYGMIGKNPYRDYDKLTKLGFFNDWEKRVAKEEEEGADARPSTAIYESFDKEGEIGFHSPYESEIDFLGYCLSDDEMFIGLPTISDEDKAKVDAIYEGLSQELKAIVRKPDWIFIGHYV